MSLNFNYEKVSGPKTFDDGEGNIVRHPTLACLIWYTIPLGLVEITKKNVPEWRFRVAVYEKLFGSLRTIKGEDACMTKQDIVDYIGLRTNAALITRAQFMRQMALRLEREMPNE